MQVAVTRPALLQLDAVLERIRFYDPRGADRALRRVEATTRRLSDHPESGRRQDVDDVREAVVPPGGTLIFCRVETDLDRIMITASSIRQKRPFQDL